MTFLIHCFSTRVLVLYVNRLQKRHQPKQSILRILLLHLR
jgi:hypothetical protein